LAQGSSCVPLPHHSRGCRFSGFGSMVLLGNNRHHMTGTTPWKPVTMPGREKKEEAAKLVSHKQPSARVVHSIVGVSEPESYTEKLRHMPGTAVESQPGASKVEEHLRSAVLKQAFDMADRDHNGKLSKGEFGLLLRRVMPDLPRELFEEEWSNADFNGDGVVSLQEFLQWVKQESQHDFVEALTDASNSHGKAMCAMFRMWDTDESGTITEQELKEVVKKVSPGLSEKDLAAIFHAMDVDHNGEISYMEFVHFLFPEAHSGQA